MISAEQLCIDAVRILSAEGVQAANSGHPGMPMGMAPAAVTLWSRQMAHNPADPSWENRDRFILSAGHGSMLLYSLLHLYGYGLTLEDLSQFRQLGSKTPGHPEHGHTVGVETTTGPLGQGFSTGVGMAIAESYLASKFNRPGFPVVDHYTYVISGDGCMMEGITSEAASLAGTLALSKLIVLYDDNGISIEGDTDIAFREDVGKRFEAYDWQVLHVDDANDTAAILAAMEEAKKNDTQPSLIVVKSVIGYGCPALAGTEKVHGAPLGAENLKCTKEFLGWPMAEPFTVPDEVYAYTEAVAKTGASAEDAWSHKMQEYAAAYPELAKEYDAWMHQPLAGYNPWADEELWAMAGDAATRDSSGKILNYLAGKVPNLIGGSADLSPSNKSDMKARPYFSAEDRSGSNMHFGVREHAMAAAGNGLMLHGGLRAYVATFFVFCDYLKGSMRLSAIMRLPLTYILTHDSIGVGEDGPTHEPVEQLVACRSIPHSIVFRPCDTREVAAGWAVALSNNDGPVSLVLTRQSLPQLCPDGKLAARGAYVLRDSKKDTPDVLLMASGSEVAVIDGAAKLLAEKGVDARVISVPSMELFDAQTACYREDVMPTAVRARVAVEAAHPMSWYKYVGLDGAIVAMEDFGVSGPYKELFIKYGFTAENVAKKAMEVLGK